MRRWSSSLVQLLKLGSGSISFQNRGKDCSGGAGGQRWYWDEGRFNCFAFAYGGCEGSLNNFLTQEACLERCRPCKEPARHYIWTSMG